MKRILFVMISLLVGNGMIQAQEMGKLTMEERVEILTEWMQEELDLTEYQLPRVKEINREFSKGMDEVMTTSGLRTRFSKFRTLSENRDQALEKVLTPQQYKTFLSIKGDMRKELNKRAKEKKAV